MKQYNEELQIQVNFVMTSDQNKVPRTKYHTPCNFNLQYDISFVFLLDININTYISLKKYININLMS